ncbi:MAG TPA: cell division ATP-binding protein FtsE [Gammaproteobacteria bacterium]|nr:cell division ATP-binding protein FtsE [Xanthomonadales bacterium]MCB1594079.1 cell division ATP-binding protein FtsE [Xanthomonadales bacterium]HOP22281.1 cell division ATP-binding protein FtsE [Gammaproteobacteria bacterium]HPI95967.1 cell division ATP-binding protein FtsE [Gammaproteobacteria bacterium]HPQ87422.1 cell division ATP-binding protein FtsE [Gammaproteobacteria bacterium]
MISFKRVSKSYGKDNKALKDVSFDVEAGEMLFLTGHSGAGKTTILRLLMLMQYASYGQIRVNSMDISSLPSSRVPAYRKKIGMIFQDHRLLNNKTVLENIALSLQIRGYSDSVSFKNARAALSQVGIAEKANFYPLELSSGQQQRVGIARAFVSKPDLILADEPTGNLDPDLSLELMQIFENLNKQGITIVIASHDLFLIKRLQKRVLVLEKGELIDDFSPQKNIYTP